MAPRGQPGGSPGAAEGQPGDSQGAARGQPLIRGETQPTDGDDWVAWVIWAPGGGAAVGGEEPGRLGGSHWPGAGPWPPIGRAPWCARGCAH